MKGVEDLDWEKLHLDAKWITKVEALWQARQFKRAYCLFVLILPNTLEM